MTEYLQRAPFLRILMPFLTGIFTAQASGLKLIIPGLPVLLILCGLLIITGKRSRHPGKLSPGILFTLFFYILGIFIFSEQNKPRNYPPAKGYLVTLTEKPVEKNRSYQAEVLVTRMQSGDSVIPAEEKLIVYFPKDSLSANLKPGSRIFFVKQPQVIENQGNPFEFNYKKYSERRGFDRQIFLGKGEWIPAGTDPSFHLTILAERTRNSLLDIYRRNGLSGNEFDVLSALTLGYRKSMDPAVTSAFAATGSTHVLSVSGLHVGIVYLMFTIAFGFMRRKKPTRIIFLMMAVLTLWMYSFLTGMSPPVMRSALMFTIVLIGENLRRPADIYNTLAASAFLILMMNSNLVFDVGFQLSYAALSGIVFFQPRLDALLDIPFKPIRYLWALFTVSIGAQLTTFPLSCFYFGQFPVYFWLSGFLVIPLSFIFIFLGTLILTVSAFPVITGFLAKTAGILVKFMIGGLQWMQELPGSVIRGFNFPAGIMLVTLAAVLCLMLFMESRKLLYFKILILLLITGFFTGAFLKIRQNHHREIIAYRADEPVLHMLYGRRNYLLAPSAMLQQNFPEWQVRPVIRHFRLRKPVLISWEDDYCDSVLVKKGNFLCFDGITLRNHQNEKSTGMPVTDIIIMQNSPEIGVIPDKKTIVVSYSKKQVPVQQIRNFHPVQEKGAWRFSVPAD